MLCEKCGKNNATTHIKRVINGVATEQYLCSSCAAKTGVTDFGQNSLVNMLASMFGDMVTDEKYISHEKRCKECGTAFSEIVETGKIGCAECYKEFYDELLPYLKRVHGSVKHVGKIPNNAPLMEKKEDRITKLREQLNELVKREDFESAAKVRDEIKEIEKEEGNNE